jgi:non-homologous end joining protein Ku
MIQAKIEGKETVEPPQATQLAPVIDIMEALKMSLQNVKKPAVSTAEADDTTKAKKARK